LRFRYLGELVVRVNGVALRLSAPSGGGWTEQRLYLSSNQPAVGWEVEVGDQAWLDADPGNQPGHHHHHP